jgi:ribose/xylose/arabinose/galactoside ABC-type transport system permease subunit
MYSWTENKGPKSNTREEKQQVIKTRNERRYNMTAIRITNTVSKTVQSAWSIALISVLIIKIFEKIVNGFFFYDHMAYLISFSVFALLFAIATAGVMLKHRWGLSLGIYATILDVLVTSYTGGIYATASVILGLFVAISSFFVYKYSFDK